MICESKFSSTQKKSAKAAEPQIQRSKGLAYILRHNSCFNHFCEYVC